ncbi:MAG: DNA-binding response regulator [Bacteroidetes bacterium HGW-Bacteroidetes-11]|jgi:DNA-binding NarL/FixJ family response regulator|nr:MAG: DNA-binding response regulator [Bacteroidetes bacterium HGW-Bacteroidetes-11]
MKLLICDDHKIVREGLRQILLQIEEVSSIIEASNGSEVCAILKERAIDIVILDISLPDKNGLEVLQIVKEKWPSTNVLMLSMHPQEQYAIRALKLGAAGYLTKDTASDELLMAVKKISAGGKYISQSLAESMALQFKLKAQQHKHELLSQREFEIMIQLANGKSLLEIGNILCISAKTVSTYRGRIMAKMELNKNTELAIYCIENDLI